MAPLTKDKTKVGVKIRHTSWQDESYAVITSTPYYNTSSLEIFEACPSWYLASTQYMVMNSEKYWNIIDEGISFDEIRSDVTPQKSSVRQEKPCQVCKRKNDLGVKVCWSCGNCP